MIATDKLLSTDPFSFSKENQELFLKSFRECARLHYDKNEFIRKLWQAEKLLPEAIVSEEMLEKVPPVMVNLFKEHELITGNKEDVVINLTSSGTSGQKSQIFLDELSLERLKKLAWEIHASLGMCAEEEQANYVCFTYDPRVATHLGTAFTDEFLTGLTQKKEVYYAIQWDAEKNDFFFNVPGTIEVLEKFSKDHVPVRLLGFPAHLYKLIKENNLHFTMPPNSWVQTGGGWKGFVNEEVPKDAFRSFIAERLGIPTTHQRDMFGMVEHGIPYCDCEHGQLHVPNYAHVLIRAPSDLQVLPHGEVGLIQFFSTYLTSYPSFSLLTTDYGRLGTCDCGRAGYTLEIVGRAGLNKHKGCAFSASKLLEPQPKASV